MKAIQSESQKKLISDFISKINNDWEIKYANAHGGEGFNFTTLKSQNAFLDDLLFDMEKSLKNELGLVETSKILISRDNLRRIFNEQQASFQERTKNTLAYYLGFNGWNDYLENFIKTMPVEEVEPQHISKIELINEPVPPKLNLQPYIFIGSIGLLLIIAGVLFWREKNKIKPKYNFEYRFEIDKTGTNANTLWFRYNFENDTIKKAQILVENERLSYIAQPLVYDVYLDRKYTAITFFTPGIKQIKLFVNDKLIKTQGVVVPTGKDWYACARVKAPSIPNPIEDNLKKAWYGNVGEFTKNAPENWITPPSFWSSYIKNGVYPNEYLHFPKDILNSENHKFTRVAYIKAGNYAIDIDSVSLKFRAKREPGIDEDCMSFMTSMVDENAKIWEYYSSSKCDVVNITLQKREAFVGTSLNSILEDLKWHSFEIKMINHKMYFIVDNKPQAEFEYKSDFKKLNELWFVFEGNGYIDDVVVENSSTKKVIISDDFNNH